MAKQRGRLQVPFPLPVTHHSFTAGGCQLQLLGHTASVLYMVASYTAQSIVKLLRVKNGVVENKDACSERLLGKLGDQPYSDMSEEMAKSSQPPWGRTEGITHHLASPG